MNRFLIPGAIFVVLAGVLYVGVARSPNKSTLTSVLIGQPAPSFSLPALGKPGAQVKSADFAGHPWVLNVWATWCGACREEHEELVRIAQLGQLPLIGLNWRDQDDEAVAWLTRLGNPYAAVAVDREGRTAIDFGVYGAPETFFIDANGRVQYRHVGAMTPDVWQKQFLARAKRAAGP